MPLRRKERKSALRNGIISFSYMKWLHHKVTNATYKRVSLRHLLKLFDILETASNYTKILVKSLNWARRRKGQIYLFWSSIATVAEVEAEGCQDTTYQVFHFRHVGELDISCCALWASEGYKKGVRTLFHNMKIISLPIRMDTPTRSLSTATP